MAQAPGRVVRRTYLRTNPRIPPRSRSYSQQSKVENAIRILREAEERNNEGTSQYSYASPRKRARRMKSQEMEKINEVEEETQDPGLDKFCMKMQRVIDNKEVAKEMLQSLRDVVKMLDRILVK